MKSFLLTVLLFLEGNLHPEGEIEMTDEIKCEHCGCTYDNPCVNGRGKPCWWDVHYLKQGRNVCSACAVVVSKKEKSK